MSDGRSIEVLGGGCSTLLLAVAADRKDMMENRARTEGVVIDTACSVDPNCWGRDGNVILRSASALLIYSKPS